MLQEYELTRKEKNEENELLKVSLLYVFIMFYFTL